MDKLAHAQHATMRTLRLSTIVPLRGRLFDIPNIEGSAFRILASKVANIQHLCRDAKNLVL